eukprot:8581639-Ditylum_brightwellii.AAC.1
MGRSMGDYVPTTHRIQKRTWRLSCTNRTRSKRRIARIGSLGGKTAKELQRLHQSHWTAPTRRAAN